ncbi:MAG: PAS domain S-box protein [Gammaproteobacteria bacterium]|nr:PAS domain S-box protein [Gammaproteobacteria bacterium]
MNLNNTTIRAKFIVIGLLACLAWGSLPAAAAPAGDLFQKRVLLLYSYHPTFVSSEAILQGVRSVLDKHRLTLHIEYMDSKRHVDEVSRANYLRTLSYKLSQRQPYDLVLISDDNALNFTLAHQTQLFPGTPIVFLAVNNVDKASQMDRHPLVTGVVEAVSPAPNVELMHVLQPRLAQVVVVVDTTPSGQADQATIHRLSQTFPDIDFKVLSLGEMTWAELAQRLAALGRHTAVLRLTAFRDKAGTVLDKTQGLALMVNSSPAPIYVLRENAVRDGTLGGIVVSHREQGREAALLAEQVLKGTPIASIKVIRESPNRPIFDYTALKRFHISQATLPPDSLVLNKPFSFIERYAGLVATTIAVVVLLTGFSTYLVWQIRARRRVEATLRHSEERFRDIAESASDWFWEMGPDLRFTYFSDRFEQITGLSANRVIGLTREELGKADPEDAGWARHLADLQGRRSFQNFEYTLDKEDGQSIHFRISGKPFFDPDGTFLGYRGTGTDITGHGQVDEALRVSV